MLQPLDLEPGLSAVKRSPQGIFTKTGPDQPADPPEKHMDQEYEPLVVQKLETVRIEFDEAKIKLEEQRNTNLEFRNNLEEARQKHTESNNKIIETEKLIAVKNAVTKYLEPNLTITFERKTTLKRSNRGKLKQFKSYL